MNTIYTHDILSIRFQFNKFDTLIKKHKYEDVSHAILANIDTL